MNATIGPLADEGPQKSRTSIYPFPDTHAGAKRDPANVAGSAPEVAARPRQGILPREQAYQISAMLLVGDWAVASVAIFCGLQLREWQRLGSAYGTSNQLAFIPMLMPWSVIGGALFTWFMVMTKTYEVANIYRMQLMVKNLGRSVVLWSVAIWAYIGLFQVTSFTPRLGVLYCGLAIIGLTLAWRLCSFIVLIQPKIRERASARVIVVGWNDKVAQLRTAMRQDLAQLGEIIGCVPNPGGTFGAKPPYELAVLGDYSELPHAVARSGADAILLADCSLPAPEIQLLARFCQREMIGFQMVPEYFPALYAGLQVQTVSGVPLLGVSQLPLDRTINRAIKRAIDVFGALVGLVLFSPVIAAFALLVFIESRGPVFYWQRRTSRGGRTFEIVKIRSMKLNAESGTGAVWCKQVDDRRLKIGAFMRKYNVDELPQFWNVLIGDMSLVGPRPERPELIQKFRDEIPNYNARHEVRAGLTGWAQIHGLRGDTSLSKRIEADLYYLENWSVMLDLYCIVATFFGNKNAH